MNDFAARLAEYRDLVSPYLRDVAAGREPQRYLYKLIDDHLSRSGKGLRPALAIATCRAFGGKVEDVLPAAAALEMLHNAFLIHDDIEDGSEFRRDRPTMYIERGLPLAVNTGDAMQALSVRLARRSAEQIGPRGASQLLDEFDHMIMESLEGQALEIGWVRDNHCRVDEDDYLRMTLKKTCWYSFIHPCRIGALVARGSSFDVTRFDRFGFLLGAAFQIQDDVLNLVGDPEQYGKEIGGDLAEGKRTLILAHLFQHVAQADATDAAHLRALMGKPRGARGPEDLAWIDDQLRRHGSLAYARAAAAALACGAASELELAFADAPESDHKNFLRWIVDDAIGRQA